ncbi:MAG: NAD(P)-binding domain-containing protein [Chloroflexi bacterium]|nr:NAD(P)-binding domain-containing protein [Chloroflexota bacterium]
MSTKHKVLFLTERSPRHQQDALASAPTDLEIVMLRRPAYTEMLQQIQACEFLITERAGVIDATLINAAPHLRLIQRLGSLTYDIDVAAAQKLGIPVCAWPIRGCILVAEHMVMQMLALVKHLPEVAAIANAAADWGRTARRTDENTFAYNWSKRTGIDGIDGKTVGILGFGEIGAELARRLSGFRPQQILYHKRQPLPAMVEKTLGLTYASQAQLIAQSDLLCCLLPFYPETELILNATVFANMKQGSFVVHCGSGSVIDEAALAAALVSGQLGGVALDTYEWEPLRPDNPLLPLARNPAMNVLLTPHTAAGASVPGVAKRSDEYENIRRRLHGEPLLYQVTP